MSDETTTTRIYEMQVSKAADAELIQLDIVGKQLVLSPELAIELANSLRRAVAALRFQMQEAAK